MLHTMWKEFQEMKQKLEQREATTAATTPQQPAVRVNNGELGFTNISNNSSNVSNVLVHPSPAPPAPTVITPAQPGSSSSTPPTLKVAAPPKTASVTRLHSLMSVNVDLETKQKCWKGDFIELYDLLKLDKLDHEPAPVHWQVDQHGGYYMQAKKSKSLTNIHDWNHAMSIYADILVENQTDLQAAILLMRGLLKYQHEIREVAKHYPNLTWVELDKNYRRRQANFPEDRDWHTFEGEVYMKTLNRAMYNQYGAHNQHQNSQPQQQPQQ